MPKDAERNTVVAFDSKYNASIHIEEDGFLKNQYWAKP